MRRHHFQETWNLVGGVRVDPVRNDEGNIEFPSEQHGRVAAGQRGMGVDDIDSSAVMQFADAARSRQTESACAREARSAWDGEVANELRGRALGCGRSRSR
jgi:hypothetical protein